MFVFHISKKIKNLLIVFLLAILYLNVTKTFWVTRTSCFKQIVMGNEKWILYSSVHFSRSVVSDSFPPHGLQHTRPPCPSPTPVVHSNSCPLSQWCHPTISSSVAPSPPAQYFPASRSFQMNQLSTSGSQSIGASASASILPMNIQDWFPLGWTGWISLQSNGLSRVFSNTTAQKHQFFSAQLSL